MTTTEERLGAIEKALDEILEISKPKAPVLKPDAPLGLDFADETSRHVFQNSQRTTLKLAKDRTAFANYLGVVETFGMAMTEIPVNAKDMAIALLVSWRTIFGSWDESIRNISPAKTWQTWFGKNVKWVGFFASVVVLGGLLITGVTNPQETLIIEQAVSKANLFQEAVVTGALGAIAVIVSLAYRSWSKKQKDRLGTK
ncbi:MAG: hypothetical protein JRM77_04735 [Nitrososphaerota archaeon]|nr:hypothetical protein [Nitrososphaerota archaeon]